MPKSEMTPWSALAKQAYLIIPLALLIYLVSSGSRTMQFSAAVFHQTRLARNGKFLFIRRADNAYLRKLKSTHCAETLSAEPRQTAWR